MPSFRSFVGSELIAIEQHLSALKSIIPNRVKLKPSERRSMFKLNTKREVFVNKSVQLMRKSPKSVPDYVEVSACNHQLHLYEQYADLLNQVDEIKQKIEDAKLLIGNEILQQTRAYFQHAKTASAAGAEDYTAIYNELNPHYAVGRNSKKSII